MEREPERDAEVGTPNFSIRVDIHPLFREQRESVQFCKDNAEKIKTLVCEDGELYTEMRNRMKEYADKEFVILRSNKRITFEQWTLRMDCVKRCGTYTIGISVTPTEWLKQRSEQYRPIFEGDVAQREEDRRNVFAADRLIEKLKAAPLPKNGLHITQPDDSPAMQLLAKQDIDPGIRDLIMELNRKGYKTYGSCEGHPGKNNPFISFEGEQLQPVLSLLATVYPSPPRPFSIVTMNCEVGTFFLRTDYDVPLEEARAEFRKINNFLQQNSKPNAIADLWNRFRRIYSATMSE